MRVFFFFALNLPGERGEEAGPGEEVLEEAELVTMEEAGLMVRGVFALAKTSLRSSSPTPSSLATLSRLASSTETSPRSEVKQWFL